MRFLKPKKLNGVEYRLFWETLVDELKNNLIPETVAFFPTYSFVSIGTWVPPEEIGEHVNIDFCKTNNITVYWEPIMGGAYFFPNNSWNCWYMSRMHKKAYSRIKKWDDFLDAVKNGLISLGIDATVEKNNILAGTRKISGTTVVHYNNKVTGMESAINMSFDYDLANQVLTPLGRRNKNLRESIVSTDEIVPSLDFGAMNTAFKNSMEEKFNMELIEDVLTDAEKEVIGLA